jgi:hypothetical protein
MKMPIALALIVAGIVLLVFGLGSADSIQNAFSRLFTGQPTDKTLWLIVGGSVCFVVGVFGCYRSYCRA